MARQDAAKAMITDDLIGITEAINICSEETRAHFMLGGLLYIATIISGAIDWCKKADISVESFISKDLTDKLRAKVKLYSSDKLIPLTQQKELMSYIVAVEQQYWKQLQLNSGCPEFMYPDVGSYLINGHYIGNTLEYAYEYSPLNPKKKPILEAIGGDIRNESLAYIIGVQMGKTIHSLYDVIDCQQDLKTEQPKQTLAIIDHDFRLSNHSFFKDETGILIFNLLCRVNYLLEFFLPLTKNHLLSFRMMYITFYHLKFDLDNLGLTTIHYDMPYRDKYFRNAMAHYSLFGKLSTKEIIDDAIGFGLFEKYFDEPFEIVNQALISELTRTRDSLEQYVTF
ncbi:MAG: hypothetical protein E7421_04650 [Ruminococcaceae bacterium]|nr:hypothetical protein [Oscillospiraceae bacterium]